MPASNPFTQGQTGTYNITVTNSGTAATTGTVTLNDPLPAGLNANTMNGSGWSCTQPGGPCTRSDALAAGSGYPAISLTVNVASNASSPLTTTATVSGGGETNTGNDSATDTTTINCSCGGTTANMTSPTPGTMLPGSSVQFQWSQLAVAVEYFLWIGTTQGGNNIYTADELLRLSDTVNGLPVDGSTIWVRLWTRTSAAGWQSNDYNYPTYSGGGGGGTPNLTIAKSHLANFTQGQTGTYTITVTNNGTAATTGTVTVNDTLPAGLTASTMNGSGWTCNPNTVSCSRSDALVVNGSYPIALTVNIPGAPGTVTHNASFLGGASIPDSTTIGGICVTGLATMSSPTPGSALSGSTVTFTWNPSCTATDYWLWIGTGGVGSTDVLAAEQHTSLSAAVSGIPASGTLYFRLWSQIAGVWQWNDYTYPIGGGTTVPITVSSSPTMGRSVTVDGTAYTTPQTFSWAAGSGHTIAFATPQAGGTGTQYVFANWSDGGGASHSVTPAVATTYTANFTTQYLLTTSVPAGGGTIATNPTGPWFNSNTSVQVTARPIPDTNFRVSAATLAGRTPPSP